MQKANTFLAPSCQKNSHTWLRSWPSKAPSHSHTWLRSWPSKAPSHNQTMAHRCTKGNAGCTHSNQRQCLSDFLKSWLTVRCQSQGGADAKISHTKHVSTTSPFISRRTPPWSTTVQSRGPHHQSPTTSVGGDSRTPLWQSLACTTDGYNHTSSSNKHALQRAGAEQQQHSSNRNSPTSVPSQHTPLAGQLADSGKACGRLPAATAVLTAAAAETAALCTPPSKSCMCT
jgi:hypothetical protein